MNLEQALAALAAANEKIGTERARADAAVAEIDGYKKDAEKSKARKDARDTAEAALKTAQAELATAKGQVENLTTDLANATKARTDAAEQFKADVKSRVALESTANAILGATDKDGKRIDRSDLTDKALKLAVIKHVDNKDVAETEHDQFVQALFLGAIERNSKVVGSVNETLQNLPGMPRADGTVVTTGTQIQQPNAEKAAAAALRDRYAEAYRTPTTTQKKDGE